MISKLRRHTRKPAEETRFQAAQPSRLMVSAPELESKTQPAEAESRTDYRQNRNRTLNRFIRDVAC